MMEVSMETRVALTEKSVKDMAEDISFIRKKMEEVSNLMQSLTRIEEKQVNQSAAVDRAFAAIEKDRVEIETLKGQLAAEREKTAKWINMGIGAWAVASVVWTLAGGIVVWWVSKVTDAAILTHKVSSLFPTLFG